MSVKDWLGRGVRNEPEPISFDDWLPNVSNKPVMTVGAPRGTVDPWNFVDRYDRHKTRRHRKPAPTRQRRMSPEMREMQRALRQDEKRRARIERQDEKLRARIEREQERIREKHERAVMRALWRAEETGHYEGPPRGADFSSAGRGFELPSARYCGPLSALHQLPPWAPDPSRRRWPPRIPTPYWYQFRPGDDEA